MTWVWIILKREIYKIEKDWIFFNIACLCKDNKKYEKKLGYYSFRVLITILKVNEIFK